MAYSARNQNKQIHQELLLANVGWAKAQSAVPTKYNHSFLILFRYNFDFQMKGFNSMKIKQLYEFLCEHIDIQIKKYVALSDFAVGPDARMNAALIVEEVNALLPLAESLLKMLNRIKEGKEINKDEFIVNFLQVDFYFQHEYLRSHAAWLIDQTIHSDMFKRFNTQQQQLIEIAEDIKDSDITIAVNESQKQCQHDSYEIAFRILDAAVKLKSGLEVKDENFGHALTIMKRFAQPEGLYHQAEAWKLIQEKHAECKAFLSKPSPLKKSTKTLLKVEALNKKIKHKECLDALLGEFKTLHPDSVLFSPKHQWHTISIRPLKLAKPTSTCSKLKFFGTAAITGFAIASGYYLRCRVG